MFACRRFDSFIPDFPDEGWEDAPKVYTSCPIVQVRNARKTLCIAWVQEHQRVGRKSLSGECANTLNWQAQHCVAYRVSVAEGKCTERSRVTWFKSVSDASFSCSCLIFLSFFRADLTALLPVMVGRADVVFCDIPTLYICDDSYRFDSCNWPNSLIGKTSE